MSDPYSWSVGATSPTGGPRRLHGAVRAVIGALVAAGMGWLGWTVPALILVALVGLLLTAALASPLGLYARIQRGIDWTSRGVAFLVGSVLLTGVFFVVLWPLGLIVRRRDRLRLSGEDGDSYWIQCPPHAEGDRRSLS